MDVSLTIKIFVEFMLFLMGKGFGTELLGGGGVTIVKWVAQEFQHVTP